MIDQNNVYTTLDLNTAQQTVIAQAQANNIVIQSGSVEEQLQNWLAQFLVEADTGLFKSYQMMFNPVGAEIDLQNPNTPRLLNSISSGYLKLHNATGAPIVVTANSIFTAPNGNTYTTSNNTVTVAAGGDNYITVYSVLTGISQNLPSGQTFTGAYTLTVTNPQPFTNGRNTETGTEYLNRITYLLTNNSSQQATPAAEKELMVYYKTAKILVNNSSNATALPVIIPPNGYIPIILFTSGVQASLAEIQNALQIIANRFEFGNPMAAATTLHPLLSGTIYSGAYPEVYYLAPAQAVKSTLTATLNIKFQAFIDATEKLNLANAFATFFAQNVVNFFGGSAGNFSCVFTPLVGSSTTTAIPLLASQGIDFEIGPYFSIEQIRALISDQNQLAVLAGMEYKSCTVLSLILDPQTGTEATVNLNISGAGGTVLGVDFSKTALFSDGSSWYDRYMYINPAFITISVNEVA